MRRSMSLILAAIISAAGLLVERFRRQPQPGLNTEQDANEFVEAMRADTDITEELEMGCCPIFDALESEWAALMARRTRSMRAPTMEMRVVFDEMVSGLDLDYSCDSCRGARDGEGPHVSCHGCECPCMLVEVSGVR